MDKKKIAQIAVIVIAFAGSGVVLYNGLYKPKAVPASLDVLGHGGAAVGVPAIAGGADNPLLPYGDKLDFDGILNSRNFQFDAIAFPGLNTTTEVGIYDSAGGVYTQPLISAPPPPKNQGK